jgi:hypothetical protein
MRRLPQIETGSVRWALLMADRSAAGLGEAVLESGPADAAAVLAEPLADDPPLALWAVLAAATRDGFRPRSITELAGWLVENLTAVLQWNLKRDGPTDASGDSQRERAADLVAERLALADAAALSAAGDGQPAAETAYLAGLLWRPEQWIGLASSGGSQSRLSAAAAACGERIDFGPAATAHAAQALKLLGGEQADESLNVHVEACRRRAQERRAVWLAPAAGLAAHLPALFARLARLEQLERKFLETLEAEKLAAMAEFAAGAGHEINNPLAIIGGRAQLFLQSETDPERRRELALMNAQVRRAHEMIADMRLFARPPQPEAETFDLAELVDALVAELGPQFSHRAITLARSGEPGPLEIEADPAQLQVALRAMCKNALEAIGHGGRIEIGLARRPRAVEIRVTDDGPGIQPDQRRHLFDPFYSARQAGRGLGLGLSKCWRIVTNHNGRIEVDSQPGRRTTFTITLPDRVGEGSSGREPRDE